MKVYQIIKLMKRKQTVAVLSQRDESNMCKRIFTGPAKEIKKNKKLYKARVIGFSDAGKEIILEILYANEVRKYFAKKNKEK